MTIVSPGHDPARVNTTCPHQTDVYGLIEWDSSETPTLIVAGTAAAVRRAAVRLIAGRSADGRVADDDPTFDLPVPGPDTADSAVTAWLAALHEATTVPWFTLYTDDDSNVITVPAAPDGDNSPAGGPAARLLVDGEPIEVWTEQVDTGPVRIDLCTTAGMGCGEAELVNGSLRVDLPDGWSPADKAGAACLIARIVYAAGAA